MAAKALGYSNSHLIQIENGASGLSIDSLLALCALYHITPNDVFRAGIAEFQACEDETIFLSSYKSLSYEKKEIALTLISALANQTESIESQGE